MKWLQYLPINFIILFLLTLMTLPAVGVIIHAGVQNRSTVLNEAARQSTLLLNGFTAELKSSVDCSQQMMEVLALLPEVQRQDRVEVNRLLSDLVRKFPLYSNILIVDREGVSWAAAVKSMERISVADRKAFLDAKTTGRFSAGEYIIGRGSQKPIINFAYPVKDKAGAFAGAILFGINLENIGSLLRTEKLPAGTSIAVFDHKGTFLHRTIDSKKYIGKLDKPHLFAQMQNGPEEGVIDIISNDGLHRLSAYRKIRLSPDQPPYAYARGGSPIDPSLARANNALLQNLGYMLAALLVTFGLGLLICKRLIVNRIANLDAASQLLAGGDYRQKVSEQVVGGELGRLAASFDTMAARLLQRDLDLAKSERFLNAIIETEPECIKLLDEDCRLLLMNPAGLAMIEAESLDQVKGQCVCPLVTPAYRDAFVDLTKRVFQGESGTLIFETVGLKGRNVWLETHAVPFRNEQGEIVALLGVTRDITERIRSEEERLNLERQLMHAQKLESLGVLAGGIAHDFNNILATIIGNADLALMNVKDEDRVREYLERVEGGAARAADLARQMLAYSGKGRFVVESLDLNRLIEEMLHMLEISVSKKAELQLELQPRLPAVDADATQIRQVIMNIVINASEAIGDQSGVICIKTGFMEVDGMQLKDFGQGEELTPGRYVFLQVADTGCGMDDNTIARLFDPFFSTKFTGRGLGMAAVQGIVRGHRGAIRVSSEPGRGTTFLILLPASGKAVAVHENVFPQGQLKGSGTVLLVDDEQTLLDVGAEMLSELGFTPVTAGDGVEAVEILKAKPEIDVVILDLTMPRMDGVQCFSEMKKIRPDIKVFMSSGFSEYEVTQKFAGQGLAGFIQKPYKMSALGEALEKLQLAPPGGEA